MKTFAVLISVAGALGLALAPTAPAAQRSCSGTVAFSGTKTVIVVLRGTTCTEAKRVVRTYDKTFAPPKPWSCGLAHAPFDKVKGRTVGFSCGYGKGGHNLRTRTHAFLGTIAK